METEKKAKELLEQIRPYLMADGGDIEFVKIENNILYVKFTGSCSTCPMKMMTLQNLIKDQLLDELPSIENIGLVE